VIRSNNTINDIDLSCNLIGDEGARHLAQALTENNTVKYIYLGSNQIGDNGVRHLANALRESKTISYISLERNSISFKGIKYLTDALKENNTINYINLGFNFIDDRGVKYFADALRKNNAIKHIYLTDNYIRTEGAKHLAKFFEKNNSIKSIDLSRNDIGDEGAKYLVKALRKNNMINFIKLDNSCIGDEGAASIAKLIANSNYRLEHIDLSYGHIGVKGLKCIAEAITKNSFITKLNLAYNKFEGEEAKKYLNKINEQLKINKHRKPLSKTVALLYFIFKNNKQLEKINLPSGSKKIYFKKIAAHVHDLTFDNVDKLLPHHIFKNKPKKSEQEIQNQIDHKQSNSSEKLTDHLNTVTKSNYKNNGKTKAAEKK